MLEQVENKIIELKKLQAEEYYRRKDADLQSWGLTHKNENGKITPIIVTDEEYEALIKASSGVDRVGRNPMGKLLTVLSYVAAVAGAVAGSVTAAVVDELPFVYFSLILVAGLVIAMIFRGISEIIRLLQQIIDGKPNEKPEGEFVKKPEAEKPKKAQSEPQMQPQQPLYQVQITPQPQQPVQTQAPVYPVYTQIPLQGGPTIYSQQPPVYVYQQPTQAQQTKPQQFNK